MTRLALAILALGITPALADTEICQTVNGRTNCVHATGNISCTTINGETRCTQLAPEDDSPPPLPEIDIPGVDIRRDGNRLRVQAGGAEIVIDQGVKP